MGSGRRTGALALGLMAAVGAGCGDEDEPLGAPEPTPTTASAATGPSTTQPPTTTSEPSAYASRVQLDPSGRPYDAEDVEPGAVADVRPLGTMHFPAGEVLVVDGSSVIIGPAFTAAEAVAVPFDVEDLSVAMLFLRIDGTTLEDVLGVRLEVDGAVVDRWGAFELAYATDGANGGVTGRAVLEIAGSAVPDPAFPGPLPEGPFDLRDVDGLPGDDTLWFTNGYGDGAFPMARGFDASGRLVALVLWRTQFPWRRAVPDGTPPPDVTQREDEIQACLDGHRPLDQQGRCTE